MKIGDLVTLLAAGMKVERTSWVKLGDIGIITQGPLHRGYRDYIVTWAGSPWRRDGQNWIHEQDFFRRDLKHVRKKINA